MTSRYFVAAILALVSLGLAACGGDDDGEVPEPTAAGTIESPTPAGVATRTSTPTITGNLFEYEEGGYSVEFPEGWTPEPNFFPGPGFSADAFFAPEEVGGIQTNISVTCETIPEELALQEYFDDKVDIVRQVAQLEPDVSSRGVDGQEAMVLHYTREDSEPPLEKTEVVFISERCGWSIAMTAPLGGDTGYEDIFDEFVGSFRLLP